MSVDATTADKMACFMHPTTHSNTTLTHIYQNLRRVDNMSVDAMTADKMSCCMLQTSHSNTTLTHTYIKICIGRCHAGRCYNCGQNGMLHASNYTFKHNLDTHEPKPTEDRQHVSRCNDYRQNGKLHASNYTFKHNLDTPISKSA